MQSDCPVCCSPQKAVVTEKPVQCSKFILNEQRAVEEPCFWLHSWGYSKLVIVDKSAATEAFCSEVELMWRIGNRQIFLWVPNMSWSLIFYICKVKGILRLSAEVKSKGTGMNSSAGFTCTQCRLSVYCVTYLNLPVCFSEKILYLSFIFPQRHSGSMPKVHYIKDCSKRQQ